MEKYFEKLVKINFTNKKSIFNSLDRIKKEFFNETDANIFSIPNQDKFNMYFKLYGEMSIAKNTITLINDEEIDKRKYFDFYLQSFFKSISLQYL